jgi:hypothetical protein
MLFAMPRRRVFKTRTFTRWAGKVGLADEALRRAVAEMAAGSIDAHLGGRVVKKRISLAGRGKRSGARTIVATNLGDRWFFLYGFGKNERADIDRDELKFLQEVAKDLLGFDPGQLQLAIAAGEIMEVSDGNETS